MTKRHSVKVGIMPFDQFKKRTLAIARGEYRPSRREPKIWFSSMKSLAHVLSESNQALLQLIIETEPASIKALEAPTGRKANNLLRTLRMMESYGFVKLHPRPGLPGRMPLVPEVIYSGIEIAMEFQNQVFKKAL